MTANARSLDEACCTRLAREGPWGRWAASVDRKVQCEGERAARLSRSARADSGRILAGSVTIGVAALTAGTEFASKLRWEGPRTAPPSEDPGAASATPISGFPVPFERHGEREKKEPSRSAILGTPNVSNLDKLDGLEDRARTATNFPVFADPESSNQSSRVCGSRAPLAAQFLAHQPPNWRQPATPNQTRARPRAALSSRVRGQPRQFWRALARAELTSFRCSPPDLNRDTLTGTWT